MELASLILPSNILLPLPFHFQPRPTGSDMYLLVAEQLHAAPKSKARAGVPAISRSPDYSPQHTAWGLTFLKHLMYLVPPLFTNFQWVFVASILKFKFLNWASECLPALHLPFHSLTKPSVGE